MIEAVKLELGDTQTLAHQENGKWVLNEMPNYAEELAKCQRYCYRMEQQYRVRSVEILADYIRFVVPLPVTLRKTPALVSAGKISIRNTNLQTVSGDFTFAVEAFFGDSVLIRATKAGHGFTDAVMVLGNSEAFLTADL